MKVFTVRRIDLKDNCRHSELHKFAFPEFKDKSFYRTSISFSAFFESTKGRNENDKYLYYLDDNRTESLYEKVNDLNRSEILRDCDKWEIDRDAELPVFYHEDLYAFFDFIGYDRKKKKIRIEDEPHETSLFFDLRPTKHFGIYEMQVEIKSIGCDKQVYWVEETAQNILSGLFVTGWYSIKLKDSMKALSAVKKYLGADVDAFIEDVNQNAMVMND